MKTFSIEWITIEGNAANIGLDGLVPDATTIEEAKEIAEYAYFLDRGEQCEGKHIPEIYEEEIS